MCFSVLSVCFTPSVSAEPVTFNAFDVSIPALPCWKTWSASYFYIFFIQTYFKFTNAVYQNNTPPPYTQLSQCDSVYSSSQCSKLIFYIYLFVLKPLTSLNVDGHFKNIKERQCPEVRGNVLKKKPDNCATQSKAVFMCKWQYCK